MSRVSTFTGTYETTKPINKELISVLDEIRKEKYSHKMSKIIFYYQTKTDITDILKLDTHRLIVYFSS